MKLKKYSYYYKLPCGQLALTAVDDSLYGCKWVNNINVDVRKSFVLERAITELDEYFNGKRTTFELELSFHGTNFQQSVWKELRNIPYGQTISYKELALRIGRPNAVRAVANAVGANPLSIFIPCHRVVGSNGRLAGYHGGLEAKRFLLNLEGADYEY